MTTRRAFIAQTLAASAALAVPSGGAFAQAWPSRPIRFVVPLPPGGGYDYLARVVAEPLQAALGQPIVIENRVGASGMIGAEYVSKQPADGYTILIISDTHLVHPSLFKTMAYDILKDFTPVGQIAGVPFALLVTPGVQAKSPKEYVALARSRPGEITFGSSGVGSPYHLAAELLKSSFAVDMLHVPYKGTGPLTTALLSGEVMSAFAPIGPFLQHIRSGKLRALGIVNGYRTSILPDVPTLEEALSLPGFAMDTWIGLVAPAGTPKTIVDRLNGEIARIVRDPQFSKEKLLQQGYEPLGPTPEQMGETMKAHLAKYAKIVRDAKIPAE
jgi:tripartite-type tricarboxylate transporter receptor subunit TctC